MAQGNHFLTIPKQDGVFTTIKSGRAGESHDDSPSEDDDEEETEEDVRFIPRCSPVPRKRGPSITDETAEYMRIRLALKRSVSFADAVGGDLVDVREFVAFDSADEEDDARWEEEEAKCRRAYLQPVYRVWPEFQPRAGDELLRAVRDNKVEVEKVTAVPDEPLAFDARICVLNVSYHKCVCVRSTMDGWITHTDSAAEYVQGSHDGDTDRFSVRLSFAEPYLFNGARVDFVVRYETSGGEFWANNSGRNYSVSLVVSYEENTGHKVHKVDDQDIKGILKPPRHRAEDDSDFCPDADDGNEDNGERETAAEILSPVCPLLIEPEIDIEIPRDLISSSKTREDTIITECPLLRADSQDEHPLQALPKKPPQTDYLEKGQSTELLIPTENITVSVQIEVPDNDPTSHSEEYILHSANAESNQLICPNQDNSQPDTAHQASFNIDTTLPGMLPTIQDMGDDDSEEFKPHRESNEIQSGDKRVEQLQDQTSDSGEVDNTESSSPDWQESPQQCFLNELISASEGEGEGDFSHSTGHGLLFDKSHESSLENLKVQVMKHESLDLRETSGKEQAGLTVGDIPDMIASSVWQPLQPISLGQTREDSSQKFPSLSITPEPEFTEYQQQGQGSECESKEVPEDLSMKIGTQSGFESFDPKEEIPMLTAVSSATTPSQSLSTRVQAVTPEFGDSKPPVTQEEPLSNFEMYYYDPASIKEHEGIKSQPALPSKTLEDANAEVDVILSKTLIPSFAFLSATVCLMVGFYEPSIFLIMALFLVSLCY